MCPRNGWRRATGGSAWSTVQKAAEECCHATGTGAFNRAGRSGLGDCAPAPPRPSAGAGSSSRVPGGRAATVSPEGRTAPAGPDATGTRMRKEVDAAASWGCLMEGGKSTGGRTTQQREGAARFHAAAPPEGVAAGGRDARVELRFVSCRIKTKLYGSIIWRPFALVNTGACSGSPWRMRVATRRTGPLQASRPSSARLDGSVGRAAPSRARWESGLCGQVGRQRASAAGDLGHGGAAAGPSWYRGRSRRSGERATAGDLRDRGAGLCRSGCGRWCCDCRRRCMARAATASCPR